MGPALWHTQVGGDEAPGGDPGGLGGGPPLYGREEAAHRAVDRVQARRAEGLHEVEDELGVDRLPRVRADALRHDELATGREGAVDLAKRERDRKSTRLNSSH